MFIFVASNIFYDIDENETARNASAANKVQELLNIRNNEFTHSFKQPLSEIIEASIGCNNYCDYFAGEIGNLRLQYLCAFLDSRQNITDDLLQKFLRDVNQFSCRRQFDIYFAFN